MVKKVIIDGIEYVPASSVKNIEKQIIKKNIHFELYPEDAPKKMTWNEAMDYCKSLGKGWRLPTISEMFYIYQCENKLISEKCYWSNTKYYNNSAWHFSFFNGRANYDNKFNTAYVHAIRDIKN